jgi:hypothetical protein
MKRVPPGYVRVDESLKRISELSDPVLYRILIEAQRVGQESLDRTKNSIREELRFAFRPGFYQEPEESVHTSQLEANLQSLMEYDIVVDYKYEELLAEAELRNIYHPNPRYLDVTSPDEGTLSPPDGLG